MGAPVGVNIIYHTCTCVHHTLQRYAAGYKYTLWYASKNHCDHVFNLNHGILAPLLIPMKNLS